MVNTKPTVRQVDRKERKKQSQASNTRDDGIGDGHEMGRDGCGRNAGLGPCGMDPSPPPRASLLCLQSERAELSRITTKYGPVANESTANGRPDVREIRGTGRGGA